MDAAHFEVRHDDDDDASFFAEIERRLLLLISEGEEEDDDEEYYYLFYNPFKSAGKKDSHPLETNKKLRWNNRMKLSSPPSSVASSKKISGTGVFIPQLPTASSVIRASSDQKQLHQRQRTCSSKRGCGLPEFYSK